MSLQHSATERVLYCVNFLTERHRFRPRPFCGTTNSFWTFFTYCLCVQNDNVLYSYSSEREWQQQHGSKGHPATEVTRNRIVLRPSFFIFASNNSPWSHPERWKTNCSIECFLFLDFANSASCCTFTQRRKSGHHQILFYVAPSGGSGLSSLNCPLLPYELSPG